jgi:hypothetical protein
MEIARTPLTFVTPRGGRVRGAVVVGAPVRAVEGGWHCRVTVEGIAPELVPIAGEDALQSLTLALALVGRLLRSFLAAGGTILDGEGAPWPVDAYFPGG